MNVGMSVQLCATCGHAEGDHQSNKSPTSPRHGICLITGCDCRQYQPAGGGVWRIEHLDDDCTCGYGMAA